MLGRLSRQLITSCRSSSMATAKAVTASSSGYESPSEEGAVLSEFSGRPLTSHSIAIDVLFLFLYFYVKIVPYNLCLTSKKVDAGSPFSPAYHVLQIFFNGYCQSCPGVKQRLRIAFRRWCSSIRVQEEVQVLQSEKGGT
uniref:Uncharacterized protein n=1 Tax=Steinernema glaseri TaxID=37863 RepID=A0A1I8A0B0_9BILA